MARLNQSRRQSVGYVYNPMVNNNVGLVQTGRSMSSVQEQAFEGGCRGVSHLRWRFALANTSPLSGEGFADIVRGIYDKGVKPAASAAASGAKYAWDNKQALAEKAHDVYSGELGTAVRNIIPDSDDTARPGFPGERHMLLKLRNGKTGVGNYMGQSLGPSLKVNVQASPCT